VKKFHELRKLIIHNVKEKILLFFFNFLWTEEVAVTVASEDLMKKTLRLLFLSFDFGMKRS